jgi:stearoyl-CoA desaturase (delta-9 desaturase)
MSPTELLDRPSLGATELETEAESQLDQRLPSDVLAIYESFDPHQFSRAKIDWVTLGWMVVMHAGCLAAPFFFTWQALGVAVVLHWLTASIGICLGYHRYLAHRSFKCTFEIT